MGTSHSGAELAHKLGRLAADGKDIPYATVREGSAIVKRAVLANAPARLRGVGKRGARLSAGYNIGRFEGTARALVFARGPWQLIERDTKAHRIPRERVRGRPRVVVIPGVGVRAYAHHPGTKGKHPWAKGVAEALPLVNRIAESQLRFALHKIF